MNDQELLLDFKNESAQKPFAYLYDIIFLILRHAIITEKYAPGESIRVTDVSLTLKVSQTPVLRAFSMLEKEGLVSASNKP